MIFVTPCGNGNSGEPTTKTFTYKDVSITLPSDFDGKFNSFAPTVESDNYIIKADVTNLSSIT